VNCFQIIKSVLDEAYSQIPGDAEEKDSSIEAAMEYLSAEYKRLLYGIQIDYSDPITRFAYIYKYVTSHANLVCTIIENSSEVNKIFDQEKVNVACIGGGPGSDFLGILKYLMKNGKTPKIKFQLCDKEKTWAESWSDVDDKVDPKFTISTSYLPLDVTNPVDWRSHTKYFQSDIFTMIYFMLELCSLRDDANEYFAHLFGKTKSNSLFLFIDNNNPEFYNWFDELAKENGLEIMKSRETSMTAPLDENKYDLGKYYEKFSYPKLKANVAFRIGRKI
jgi:hypothetical protein